MSLRLIKKNDHYDGVSYSNRSIEFHPYFRKATIRLDTHGYFDERPILRFTLTTMLGLIGLIISPFFGLYFMFICLGVFLFISWGQTYIKLPIKTGEDEKSDSPSYGFYMYSDNSKIPTSLWICRGSKFTVIELPWSMQWVRTSLLLKDGLWEHETEKFKKEFYDEFKQEEYGAHIEHHQYIYVLKDGTVQTTNARCIVKELESRPKWFMWTSLFKKVRRYIDITFKDEIGEGTGSYKGGTIGCSYDMKDGETVYHTLSRMSTTRKFN